LDNFDLIKRITIDSSNEILEIRTVRRLGIFQKNKINECKLLGGNNTTALDDYGKHSIRIVIEGDFVGKNSKQSAILLRSKYKSGNSLKFLSDITLVAYIQNILIEELYIQNNLNFPHRYSYKMHLIEDKESLLHTSKQNNSSSTPSQSELAIQNIIEETNKIPKYLNKNS
jgi:hypothetical protein